MREFIKTMKSLSDPNRARIIKLLQQEDLCVCQIKERLRIAQSTTSNHLKILEEAGMVSFSKKGLWVRYRLAHDTENLYSASMLGNMRHWLEEDLGITAMAGIPSETQDHQKKNRTL